MTTVQTTNTVPADLLASVNGTKKSTSTAEEAQNRFMTLLVTQMKNQDPLNPLDNAQVTSQLAQLSTVTGIDKLNATLQALQGSYQTSQSLQAASMIGHGILSPGSTIDLAQSSAIFGVDLAEAADNVKVVIRDKAGVIVRTMDMGAQEAGTMPLAWDGKTDKDATAADGSYKFEISATRGEDSVKNTALSFGLVNSVTTSTQGVKLNVQGAGAVPMTDVRQIL